MLGGDCLSKDVEDEWQKKAKKIETMARWLREGDVVEVVYGEFEEVQTDRVDKRTGNPYQTTDFKITVLKSDGSKAFRLIDKYVFVDLMKSFKAGSKDGVMPKTIQYRRPVRRRY